MLRKIPPTPQIGPTLAAHCCADRRIPLAVRNRRHSAKNQLRVRAKARGETTVSLAISDCVKHDDAKCCRDPGRRPAGRMRPNAPFV